MVTRQQIEQLEAFDAHGARVLSVYLALDPSRQLQRSYRVIFDDLVKDARQRLDTSARVELESEAARVQKWLEDEEPHGKGVALFSSTSANLWQAYHLPVRIRDHVAFEPWPDVAILLEAVDDYGRFAVALVDKRRARLFSVFLGEIESGETFEDEVPNRHHQGGMAQSRLQRQHETHVHWHLKRVEQHLSQLLLRRRFDRLIIAGPGEATTELQRLLPKPLAGRLVAVVPGEMTATDSEILERTLDIERRVERDGEERLLKELIDTARAGGRAICGVRPTLDALRLGEVQMLVVADGVHAQGGECPNCGQLQTGSAAACSACGTPIRPTDDVFHRAMGRALEQADDVQVVHDVAARRLQEAGGGLGALLRFR